jgi:hypothetical protein
MGKEGAGREGCRTVSLRGTRKGHVQGRPAGRPCTYRRPAALCTHSHLSGDGDWQAGAHPVTCPLAPPRRRAEPYGYA